MSSSPCAARGATVLLVSLLLSFAGCASDAPTRGPGHRPTAEPLPTLTGHQAFFDGRITADLRISAMTGPTGEREGRGKRSNAPAGHHRGGREGGRGMRPPGEEGGLPPGEGGGAPGMRTGAPAGPAVAIHLKFTNHGPEPVELHVTDFLSPLGNFVVTPETLTLAPGASAETDPLASSLARQMGAGEITLTLQLGTRRESKAVPMQTEASRDPGNGKTGQTL